MHRKQMKAILTRPRHAIRYRTQGKLPRMVRPQSPLIDVLERIPPRLRTYSGPVRMSPELGYLASHTFRSLEAMLRWVRPDDQMLEDEPWPAESWRDKRFQGPLSVETVIDHCLNMPEQIAESIRQQSR